MSRRAPSLSQTWHRTYAPPRPNGLQRLTPIVTPRRLTPVTIRTWRLASDGAPRDNKSPASEAKVSQSAPKSEKQEDDKDDKWIADLEETKLHAVALRMRQKSQHWEALRLKANAMLQQQRSNLTSQERNTLKDLLKRLDSEEQHCRTMFPHLADLIGIESEELYRRTDPSQSNPYQHLKDKAAVDSAP